jgi:glycosyltransferase involved in cell wall biosynthesis
MDKYLSVIVPVYNVEDYLHKCIDSIINQTFSDIEIILVNDGSSDTSPQICDDYKKKDVRIKVIHQQNAGVSVARNKGIEAATGNYVTFVDSDDWLEPTMYESMCAIAQLEQPSDVVMCDFVNIKTNSKEEISANIRKGFYSKQQIIDELYPTLLVTEDVGRLPIVSVWSCLLKRSFLIDNDIRFDAALMYSEDYLFMADVMINANSFYYLKGNYSYNYRQYEESRSKKFQSVWWENLLRLNKELEKLLGDYKDYNFTKQIKLQLLHSVLFILNSIYKNDTMTIIKKQKEIAFILKQQDLIDAFYNLNLEKQPKTLKLMLYFIKYKMAYAYLFFQRTLSTIKNAKDFNNK